MIAKADKLLAASFLQLTLAACSENEILQVPSNRAIQGGREALHAMHCMDSHGSIEIARQRRTAGALQSNPRPAHGMPCCTVQPFSM